MEGNRLILAVLSCICIIASGKKIFNTGTECFKPSAARLVHCNWHYLAYMPRVLRAGVAEKVLVTTQNVDFDVTVEAKLLSTRSNDLIVAGKSVVKPGVLTEIVIKIPSSAPSWAIVQIEGRADVPAGTDGLAEDAIWTFKNKTGSINIQRSSTTVFIQTDRPIYKPGESMKMRVVAVDSDLKPLEGIISIVSILNPSQSLMRQWRQVKLYNGVASFKLKLSIKPVLGIWKIQATVKGVTKTVQVKVEKYVLPKFQVILKPPPYIALGQEKVYAEVCAKYSYGKNVAGLIAVEICAKFPGHYNRVWKKATSTCVVVLRKVFGCEQIEVNLNEFKVYQYSGYSSITFSFAASVTETATGIQYNATKVKSKVENTNVKLSFDGTPEIFKPGLPFQAMLQATRPDGSPIDNLKVKLKVTAGWSKVITEGIVFVKNGRVKIHLPEIPFDAKEVKFRASYKRPKIVGSHIQDYKRHSDAYHTSKAWYSPSHSYLSIEKPNTIFKVGREATVKVQYTSVDTKPVERNVYYTLMCKGYAAHSGMVKTEFIAASSRARRSVDIDVATKESVPMPEPTSSGPEPTTVDPEPATADLEPATADLEPPTTSGPEPTTSGPEPMTAGPEPMTADLKPPTTADLEPPTTADLEPPTTADLEPPTTSGPEPMTSGPEPTTAGPEPKTSRPTPKTVPRTTEETTTPPKPTTILPWWWERKLERVTRPPLPASFSSGSFDISFKVRQEMSPSCRMLVYYVRGRETVADSTIVDVADTFANKVTMKFSEEEVLPGTKVQLSLKASPGSIFAISAVDKSVHFLANANEVKTSQVSQILKDLDVGPGHLDNNQRCGSGYYWWHYSETEYVDSQKAFNDGGLVFMSSVQIDTRPCGEDLYGEYSGDFATELPFVETTAATFNYFQTTVAPDEGSKPSPVSPDKKKTASAKPKVRTEFPETWLWTEERMDEATGEKVIDVKVPDTITTWYASGFAISGKDGLGVANPAEIRGFKAVFVSVNLPYSVIRGELVTIPVVAFNYLSSCLNVRISLKRSKDFELITRNHVNTCICGGRTATVMFKFYARRLGRIALEATAESQAKNNCPSFVEFDSNNYIDIVRKKLLVEPEGIEKEYTFNSLVCPKENSSISEKVKLSIPDKVVQGSVYSELRVIGDLMGPSLNNIDNLLKMPYGCGEQNMLNFAPNIFIMQYLKATGQLTSEIEEKAVGYTLQGYQRQLSYKHSDGSYSAFGKSDKEGSMWLTAFVLKSFAQAREFIDIDKKVLADAKKWILSKQNKDGCFPTIGTLHSKSMKGGVKTPVTLTGYVVVALLEADMKPENPNIKMAIKECIKPQLSQVNDTYSLNILAYTMAKAGRNKELTYLLTKLDSMTRKEGDTRYWGSPKPKAEPENDRFFSPYYQAKSDDIEQTAYGLMARVPEGSVSAAVGNVDIVRWLSAQRNSLGGWASTQDTVLAMQALAMFSSIVHGGEIDLTVDAAVPGLAHRFSINNKNSLVLQKIKIPAKFPATLKTFAKGKGCALLSASVKYNVKTVQEEPAFKLVVRLAPLRKTKKLKFGRCMSQEIDICATWLKEEASNMAIISVKMLSGFDAVEESLQKAVSRDPLLKEYEKKGKDYVFYYSRIGKIGVCLTFKMKQAQIVQNIKPSSVVVYDYYDKGMSATTAYEVTPAKCAGIHTPDI
ncbi:alpha-1-macroglobulin-like isoform X3 [Rhopilema esculentum]|uniref:alpha-1-macroglobulin-like isoform X3 n=1 Tax=Rhopilema esculentum TaxID=499914 RepID=UPI0031CE9472